MQLLKSVEICEALADLADYLLDRQLMKPMVEWTKQALSAFGENRLAIETAIMGLEAFMPLANTPKCSRVFCGELLAALVNALKAEKFGQIRAIAEYSNEVFANALSEDLIRNKFCNIIGIPTTV